MTDVTWRHVTKYRKFFFLIIILPLLVLLLLVKTKPLGRGSWTHLSLFFLWTILSLDDPQKFWHWSDVALYICNYDVIMKAPMTLKKKSHSFPMKSTCSVPSFNFFFGVVSEIEVQSFSVFPTWLPHHVTYDVIIINKTFDMSNRSDGENFVSIRQAVANRQTDRQTN